MRPYQQSLKLQELFDTQVFGSVGPWILLEISWINSFKNLGPKLHQTSWLSQYGQLLWTAELVVTPYMVVMFLKEFPPHKKNMYIYIYMCVQVEGFYENLPR